MTQKIRIFSIVILAMGLVHCSFKKLSSEHPYPAEARVKKSFFYQATKSGRLQPRTFLAGWSPEYTAGGPDQVMLTNMDYAGQTNIQFEVTRHLLVGRKINPSYPNDPRRWDVIVTIPITKHFYLERQKDSRGRDTDTWFENDQRSDYSARPYMNLDLTGIQIKNWSVDLFWSGYSVNNVYDIDWDRTKGFLGFTLSVTSSQNAYSPVAHTGDFRFNFMEFQHDPSFKVTPYSHKNASLLNVLHLMGHYYQGDPANPILYGAHWDTRKKHTIYLFGFPDEYVPLAKAVIERWNDAFERVGHGRPFNVAISPSKYAFDLRYPTIVYIADRRLSYRSPLGVAISAADVLNGETLWGQVTIWGGELESMINSYSPNADIESSGTNAFGRRPIVQLSLMDPQTPFPRNQSSVPDSLLNLTSFGAIRAGLASAFQQELSGLENTRHSMGSQSLNQLARQSNTGGSAGFFNPVASLVESSPNGRVSPLDLTSYLDSREKALNQLLGSNTQLIDQMSQEVMQISGKLNALAQHNGTSNQIYNANYIQKLIDMPTLQDSIKDLPVQNPRALQALVDKGGYSRSELMDLLNQPFMGQDQNASGMSSGDFVFNSPAAFDMDRTFADTAQQMDTAISKYGIDKLQALRRVLKLVMIHELGHFMGLGHNFKENILPEKGYLPDTSKHLDYSYAKLKEDAERNFTNMTTVMGYESGITDILVQDSQIKPGPQDILSLEYLYNQRYPVYPNDAHGEGDMTYVPLKADGIIRQHLTIKGRTYHPAYFPSCNDYYASNGADPYCARWDRGYNATTIVQNYFDTYKGNLVSQLNAFSNDVKGGSWWLYENYLWNKSMTAFSHVRMFYDYMRQKYASDIQKLVSGPAEQSTQNLLDFSSACQSIAAGGRSSNAALEALFTRPDKKELLDLCVANAKAMGQFEDLLQLPGKDYTQVDYFDQYTSASEAGGEANDSMAHAFGTWKELARTPIKISALMTLTSPYPFLNKGGWVWPIPQYSRQDGAFHVSTLYPKEYTSAIASATEMNLNMGDSSLDDTTSIGKTVLAMGYYLHNTEASNDVLKVNTPFIDNIRNQTNFNYEMVTVIVNKKDEDGKEIAKQFNGTIYNLSQQVPETLPEIYMYTNNRVVMMPPPQSLLMPMTQVRWFSPTSGYFYAIKLDYSNQFFDHLKAKNVRMSLAETYYNTMKRCVQGIDSNNGLRYYFNDLPEFPGFKFPATINEKTTDQETFFRSVGEQFQNYYANKGPDGKPLFSKAPDPQTCEEALRGQGLLVMTASVLNGYYLPNLSDYIQKGYSW